MYRLLLIVFLALQAIKLTAIGQDAAQPPLAAAASKGDAAAVKALLEAGADVNAVSPTDYGKTALHLAAEKGRFTNVRRSLGPPMADITKSSACCWRPAQKKPTASCCRRWAAPI